MRVKEESLSTKPAAPAASSLNRQKRILPPSTLIIFSGAVVLAAILRFYKLGEVPPALNGDEAVFGVGAMQLLQNGPSLYVEGQGGAGVLASYIVAFFFLLLEPGKLALRFQASLFGLLTVILLFFTTGAIFLTEATKKQVYLLAPLSALILAVNSAHATISRIAFAVIQLPFLQLLAILFFWLGYQKGKRLYFLLGGIFLALVLYGYLSGVVTPGIFLAFAVTNIVVGFIWPGEPPAEQPRSKGSYAGLKYFVVTFFIFILPLIFFYATNLNQGSAGRLTQASFLNPNINQGDPWEALWRGIRGNYAAFGLAPLDWLAQGAFDQILAAPLLLAAFIGLLISLARIKRSAYQFILLWWGLTIVPAALAPDLVPHASRAIGVYPPMSILAALAITETVIIIGNSLKQLRTHPFAAFPLAKLLAGIIILGWGIISFGRSTWQRFDYYFRYWPYEEATLDAFDLYAVELARDMATLARPQSAFLLPRNTSSGSVSPNNTVNFLYDLSNSPASYYWITDDEQSLPQALSTAARDVSTINVVRWKVSKHTGADPKEVIHYYLEKHGRQTNIQHFRYYDIETYALEPSGHDFGMSEVIEETQLNFGGQITLTGYAFGNAGPGDYRTGVADAGESVWVKLRWEKVADYVGDLKVSLVVKDIDEHRLVFVDKYLQNNYFHQRSSLWDEGSVEDTYFILPLPQEAMPGLYSLSILVYDDETLAPLPTTKDGQFEYVLGELQIDPSQLPLTDLPADIALQRVGSLAGRLELYIDQSALPAEARPGQKLEAKVVWKSMTPPAKDYAISAVLKGDEREQTVLSKTPIGGEMYPTSRWRADEHVGTWITFNIPPGTDGLQSLTFILWQNDRPVALWPVTSLNVADWEHHYDLPARLHPLEATLGDRIVLLGYTIDLSAGVAGTPETTLQLTLYWQGNERIGRDYIAPDYSSFVHVLDGDAKIVSQIDHIPANGIRPTTGWISGEIISDAFTFNLPQDLDVTTLTLAIGMYSQEDFKRLPVELENQVDDKVLIPLSQYQQ